MNFKQRSLRDFQKEHKQTQPTAPVQPRDKQIRTPERHKPHHHERLPNGSEFHFLYNDNSKKWSGTLVIYQTKLVNKVFTDEARSVFHLLYKLDKQYRKYLKEQSGNATDKAKVT
jgi:stress-induced morphogen